MSPIIQVRSHEKEPDHIGIVLVLGPWNDHGRDFKSGWSITRGRVKYPGFSGDQDYQDREPIGETD